MHGHFAFIREETEALVGQSREELEEQTFKHKTPLHPSLSASQSPQSKAILLTS